MHGWKKNSSNDNGPKHWRENKIWYLLIFLLLVPILNPSVEENLKFTEFTVTQESAMQQVWEVGKESCIKERKTTVEPPATTEHPKISHRNSKTNFTIITKEEL